MWLPLITHDHRDSFCRPLSGPTPPKKKKGRVSINWRGIIKKSGNNSFSFLSYVFISLKTFTHRGLFFFFQCEWKHVLFYYKSTSLFLDRSYLSRLSHCGQVRQPVTNLRGNRCQRHQQQQRLTSSSASLKTKRCSTNETQAIKVTILKDKGSTCKVAKCHQTVGLVR